MKWLVVAVLRGYRTLVSPLYGPVCRYHPSCSAYALEAVSRHGPLRGGWLAARRVVRCNPWSHGGYDPVPGAADEPSGDPRTHAPSLPDDVRSPPVRDDGGRPRPGHAPS